MVRSALLLLLSLLLAAPGAARAAGGKAPPAPSGGRASTTDDAARTQVQRFVEGYLDAANRADVSAMMEMFSRREDVSSVTDGVITRGWESIREDNDQFAGKEGQFRFSPGTIDVTPLGPGYALAVAPVVVTVVAGGDTLQADSALTLLLEKVEGKWKILHEHMSGQESEDDQDLEPGDGDGDQGGDEGD